MKYVFILIMISFLFFLPAGHAFADTSVDIEDNGDGASSDVHVDNSVGQSTTCVNGNCTTTGSGNNSTTVCINGKCTTSQDGNVDRQEGGSKVKIENHSMPSITVSPPRITPTPTHSASINNAQDKSSGQAPKKESSNISTFEEMIHNLQKLMREFFSQNK